MKIIELTVKQFGKKSPAASLQIIYVINFFDFLINLIRTNIDVTKEQQTFYLNHDLCIKAILYCLNRILHIIFGCLPNN